jgi:hypothetical protein
MERGCPQIELSGVHNKGDTMLYSEMTDKIINSFYKVYDVLSYGFLENFKRAIFSNERKEISEIETSNPCESAQSASSAFYSSG